MLTPVVGGTPLPVAKMLACDAGSLRRTLPGGVGVREAEPAHVVGDAEAAVCVGVRHRDRVGREPVVRQLQHVAVGQPAVGAQLRQRVVRLLARAWSRGEQQTLGPEAARTGSALVADGQECRADGESAAPRTAGERRAGLVEVART